MKRLLSLMTVLVLLMTSLSACRKAGVSEQDLKSMLVSEKKDTLVMVTKSGLPPYVDDYGTGDDIQYSGIDVQIAEKIAEKLGLKLDIKSSYELECDPLTAVQTGKADIAMGGIVAEGEQVLFSNSYDDAQYVVVVVNGSPIKTQGDLDLVGKISAAKDTDLFAACSTECGVNRMVACADETEAISQLTAGKVQCAMVSESAALAACENDDSLILCEDSIKYESKDKDGNTVTMEAKALVRDEKYNSIKLVQKGYRIGTTEGTACGQYCIDTYGNDGKDRVHGFANGSTAMQALLTGVVDCAILDDESAKVYQRANDNLVILSDVCKDTKYSIGVSKNNPKLNEEINKILKEMDEDGTLKEILAMKDVSAAPSPTATATAAD